MEKTAHPGIYKRGSKYLFVLPFVDAKGHHKQKWVSGFDTWLEADKERTRLKYRRDTGLDISPEKLTLEAYGKRWLAHKKNQVAPNTYDAYQNAIRRAGSVIGGVLLTSLKPFHVQQMVDELLQRGASPSTVNQTRGILSRALRQAADWDLVSRNVATSVRGLREPKRDFRLPTSSELTRLFEAADQQGIGALVRLAVLTGLRISELLALSWTDIDFEDGSLHVKASKTPAGVRTISVGPATLQLLRELREESGVVRLSGLVLGLQRSRTIWPWINARSAAGLPGLHFHDLRHVHVSLLIEQGEDFKVIQERVGHSSIRVTLDRYGHLRQGADREAASKIERVLADS